MAGAPEVNVAIRVRGLSHEERYFDEQASATRVTRDFIVIRLSKLVDLENEIHITSLRTQVGGIFRVSWINTQPEEGLYWAGLELLDPEGDIWEPESVFASADAGSAAPAARLECQRCARQIHAPVPEAADGSLREGFVIARPCDTCKATTGWAYVVERPVATEANSQVEMPPSGQEAVPGAVLPPVEPGRDQRQKGRAPIHLTIKIIRTKYGLPTYDVCQTINVSRTGVYFITEQGYDVGENLKVILPYHPDSVAIPVPARVVRQDERPGSYEKGVAIQITLGTTKP
jgi:hypothetical protein